MKKALLVLLSVVFFDSNFVIARSSGSFDNSSTLEKLVNYELENGYMTISVNTLGCTGVNSFKIVAEEISENSLKIIRVKQDTCGMKPRAIELQYSIRHLGLDLSKSITIINPLFR